MSPKKEASSFTSNSPVPAKPQLHEKAELSLKEVQGAKYGQQSQGFAGRLENLRVRDHLLPYHGVRTDL